jgi:dTDP-4-amino-4,6-dideoxygalactose transaminase
MRSPRRPSSRPPRRGVPSSAARAAVPFVDLAPQHDEVARDLRARIDAVLQRNHYILGEELAGFEADFARYCGAAHCVGVANGSDALELSLRALGVGPGDEVIVPAFTFVATALAALRVGARPVFVDVTDDTLLLDPDAVARALSPQTRAVIPVHLYGQCAPMEALAAVAAPRGVPLIEDAAQAHGAWRNGQRAGTLGALAAFSFYPGKNLGALGDGGAVTTSDAALARTLRALRNYGSEVKYEHPVAGWNSRLDELQAAALSVKLPRLDGWNALRAEAAARYDALLAGDERVRRVATAPGNVHARHLYVVRVEGRDEVLTRMAARGVSCVAHYPRAVHTQGAFAHLGHAPEDFPVANRAAAEVLSLPLYPGITASAQCRVIDALRDAL